MECVDSVVSGFLDDQWTTPHSLSKRELVIPGSICNGFVSLKQHDQLTVLGVREKVDGDGFNETERCCFDPL